jgi:hypothetical protein
VKPRVLVAMILMFVAVLGSPSAASPRQLDTRGFSFFPTSGPPGTRVHFDGNVPTDANDFDTYQVPDFAYGLSAIAVPTNPTDCDLIVQLDQVTKTVTPEGHVTGSFTVGREGGCFMSATDAGPQPARPGVYAVLLSCHACTPAGTFTITSAGLARTGRPTLPLAVSGIGLVAIGTMLLALAHRRRATPTMANYLHQTCAVPAPVRARRAVMDTRLLTRGGVGEKLRAG